VDILIIIIIKSNTSLRKLFFFLICVSFFSAFIVSNLKWKPNCVLQVIELTEVPIIKANKTRLITRILGSSTTSLDLLVFNRDRPTASETPTWDTIPTTALHMAGMLTNN